MKTYELYNGSGSHKHILNVCNAESWKKARAIFAEFGYWGTCTLIGRAKGGSMIDRHSVKFS